MKRNLIVNSEIIERAKEYARENGISLSSLVKNYLRTVINDEMREIDITPLVKNISGVVDLPGNCDSKKDYTEYLMKKHS